MPVRGSALDYSHKVWYRNTKMVCLPDGEKTENMFPRFGTIFECDGHPDGRTERHHTTAEAMLMCSIVQQKLASDSMLCSIEAHPTCRVDL